MTYSSELNRKIYFALPFFVRNIMASVYGSMQRASRYSKTYFEHLDFLKKSQYWTNDKLLEFSKHHADDFIVNSVLNSEFYSEDKYKWFKKGENISKLPLLSKDDLRNNLKKVYSSKLKSIKHRWSHTSGTTGKALVFPLSNDCFQKEYAFRAMHYLWGNINLHGKDKVAFCSGHPVAHPDRNKPPFWIYDYSNNWLFLSSYHMTEDNLKSYVLELDNFMPLMLGGYPSSIYLIAKAYKKYGKGKLPLISIYCSSETLLDFQRREIEDAFQAKVFNWYGTSEMCVNIVECEKGEMHLKYEHSYIEILDNSNKPCNPGEQGRVVCTAFANEAFPLIRYDIGDEVVISENQQSKCDKGGLLIDSILGRVEDYIITGDGRMVGRLDHIFKDSMNVKEAQIYQDKPGEIVLRIVKNNIFTKNDENALLNELFLRLGSNIKVALIPKVIMTLKG